MRLVFITEARFIKLPDGRFYSLESSFAMPLYRRYLENFDEIVIFARTKNGTTNEVIETNLIVSDKVKVIELPCYVGFNQFLKLYLKLRNTLKQAIEKYIDPNTVILCRIPGRVGATAISILKNKQLPYGIEVVGDPFDVLSNGATNHSLAPIIRYFSYNSLRKIASSAPAALYVTRYKLQERYPCKQFSIGVSDVVMTPITFIESPRLLLRQGTAKLICIGTLGQMYKAPDVIIKSLKILIDRGISCELKWIGEGIFKEKMIMLVNQLNLGNNITFTGKLPGGAAVRNELDRSDIFVMASRMEGLPRAMVEAMARGLPCIGTAICGIPELLDKEALVTVNDVQGLADKIEYFIKNKEFTQQQAIRNLAVSHTFEEEILNVQRKQFYDYLKRLVKQVHE
ncbi:MAG TPA: glycosyltransferase [Paludibacter sp.]